MEGIAVFYNEEEARADKLFKEYIENNANSLKELKRITRLKELEYKERTGWTERFLKKREDITKGKRFGKLNPSQISLSLEEKMKFKAQYSYLGKGLKLNCLISLVVWEEPNLKKYLFGGEMPDYGIFNSSQHTRITGLVKDTHTLLHQLTDYYSGVKVNPVFYTILEKVEGGALTKDLREFFDNPEDVEFLEETFNLNNLEKEKEVLDKIITRGFPIIGGLSEEERKRFNGLFYQE
jgi:hypothetical protein